MTFKLITGITCFLFVLFASGILAQEGFKIIEKAEREYARGNLEKALTLSEKASGMDYGFCGLSWLEGQKEICMLRYRIFTAQANYEAARKSLDSLVDEQLWDRGDSLRIRTWQLQYGADSLREILTSDALDRATITCDTYDCYALIPLTNGTSMRMRIVLENYYGPDWNHDQILQDWIHRFRQTRDYEMLFGKS